MDNFLHSSEERPVAWAMTRGGDPSAKTLGEARNILDVIDVLTVDVETSGMPPGHTHYMLKTIQLGDANTVVILAAEDNAAVHLAADQLDRAPLLTAHACQADLIPVATAAGVDPERWVAKMLDTIVLAPLVDPRLRPKDLRGHSQLGLKALAAHLLDDAVTEQADADRQKLFTANGWLKNVEPDTPPERNGWLQVSIDDPVMLRYAAADVLDGAALAAALMQRIQL